MADITEFVTPGFLDNQNVESIHDEMLNSLPSDISTEEGGIAWDFTRPTAIQIAYIMQYILPETIKQIFPQYAYGDMLDYHAQNRGMSRNEAVCAQVELLIKGRDDTVINSDARFSTESSDINKAVFFKPILKKDEKNNDIPVIIEHGEARVTCVAEEAGTIGNVAPNTIILVAKSNTGINSVTNELASTGGVEEESDEDLRQRIVEFDRQIGSSFIGNINDYKRWAMEVDGVGNAIVIPANDTSGTVRIIVTYKDGQPASDELRNRVKAYIMGEDGNERLAPINALVSVDAPISKYVDVHAKIKFNKEKYTIEDITNAFRDKLVTYFLETQETNIVLHTRVGALLIGLDSVDDYSDLQLLTNVSGSELVELTNIELLPTQMAVLRNLELVDMES